MSGVKIAARSGGHSNVGASTANRAMVIDLRQLPGRDCIRRCPRIRDGFGCSRNGFGADHFGAPMADRSPSRLTIMAICFGRCAAAEVQPVGNMSRNLSRMDFVHYFEGGADATQPRAFVAGSDIVGEMTHAAAESIVAATTAWPQAAGSATTVVESLSGAAGRRPAEVRPRRIHVLGRQLLRNRPATSGTVRPTDLVELS